MVGPLAYAELNNHRPVKYEGYFASVHFSAEDEVFFGKIIGINDSVTFEGGTVEELKKAFHEAVNDYLGTCKQPGKEPGRPGLVCECVISRRSCCTENKIATLD